MEAEGPRANDLPHILCGVFPALSSAVFISIAYIDPGKWVACIDSGARFGGDLALFLFLFNLMAILCQYLSAHVAVISGKNLAQICNDGYDKFNCICLGIQAELSMIMSDLAMILGVANGLHMMFRVDLFSAVLLTALNAILYPLFSTLLETSKATTILIRIAGLTFVCYVIGMLISQPEISISPIFAVSKLRGENVYALMSLLGANIIPHNFYLHSSVVQRLQGKMDATGTGQAYDNFFGIFTIFSCIFIVNYVLMNSAANIFYGSGPVLPTFQDAMSLMEQPLWSPIAPLALFLLISSSHISALSWEIGGEGGQTILYDFFGVELPGWLHCATVRIFAIVPALYCLWYSGAEGMYQMLISTQIMVACLLPPSVIALYRIASSRALMGTNKISAVMEFFLMMSLMAMIGLQLIFLGEMACGNSDWLGYLRWNMGTTSISGPYFILIVSCCASLCFTCWLFATPLRSADERSDAQPRKWDILQAACDTLTERQDNDMFGTRYYEEQSHGREEMVPSAEKVLKTHLDAPPPSYDFDLPETIMENPYLTPIEENSSVQEQAAMAESVLVSEVIQDCKPVEKIEAADPAEKTLRVAGELITRKDGEEGETWEVEASKGASRVASSTALDDPRSLNGKLDEGGNGPGSLSRISGLGRAARRQLAAVLDEFWEQLYDRNGQLTQEAKAKRLDLLLSSDSNSKPSSSLSMADSVGKELGAHFDSLEGGGSDYLVNSSFHDVPSQQMLPNSKASAYGVQKGSLSPSLWRNKMQPTDAYLHSTDGNALDSIERRYSSLRLPPSSEVVNYQPATLHGYQFPSYINRTAKDQSANYMNGQWGYVSQAPSPSLGVYSLRDPLAFGLKTTSGFSAAQTSAFHNPPASRNSMLQSDESIYELFSPTLAENMANQNNPKKYHSLPDISGIALPRRDVYSPDKYTQWASPNSVGFAPSVVRTNLASRFRAPPGFDELSAHKACRGVLPSRTSSGLGTTSLWHKQPFEQFGVANKTLGVEGTGQNSLAAVDSATSMVDLEVKLLQSLRQCILKLLKLEGSEWLFRQTDCVDEDLINRVAARERFVYEAEFRDMKLTTNANEPQYTAGAAKPGSGVKGDGMNMVFSVPHCGEGCVWKADMIVSFGVWCIHRILELSQRESRPELWGKYTYVLNHLQGVIDLAFFKQRNPMSPCFCLQVPATYQQGPTDQPPAGKFTTPAMLLEIIKEVKTAISSRKGRSAAVDVAFSMGKENLTSVLKRYKRRLSNKPVASTGGGGSSMPGRPSS